MDDSILFDWILSCANQPLDACVCSVQSPARNALEGLTRASFARIGRQAPGNSHKMPCTEPGNQQQWRLHHLIWRPQRWTLDEENVGNATTRMPVRHPFPSTSRPSHWSNITQWPQIGTTCVQTALVAKLLGRTKEPEKQMQTTVSASESLSSIDQVLFGKKNWQPLTNELQCVFCKGPISLWFGLQLCCRVLFL